MEHTAEIITLDGRQVIQVKRGPYLAGDFRTVDAVAEAGIDLAKFTSKRRAILGAPNGQIPSMLVLTAPFNAHCKCQGQ